MGDLVFFIIFTFNLSTFQIQENVKAEFSSVICSKKPVPFPRIEVVLMQKKLSVLFSGRRK